MANRSIPCTAVLVLTLLATVPGTQAQSCEKAVVTGSISGINTDRLTSKQLRIWNEIGRIAEAADKDGRPLHPRLHSLWQWARGNEHAIIIEMAVRRAPTDDAGDTTLEQGNSNGDRPAAILWLHPWAIDNACVNPRVVRRPDGLIPFYGLGKYERYAEVVGHELTHALLMLRDPEYARLCSVMHVEAAELLIAIQQSGMRAFRDDTTRQRQQRVQSMYEKIEGPAEEAELEIWRELLNGQARGVAASGGVDSVQTAGVEGQVAVQPHHRAHID